MRSTKTCNNTYLNDECVAGIFIPHNNRLYHLVPCLYRPTLQGLSRVEDQNPTRTRVPITCILLRI